MRYATIDRPSEKDVDSAEVYLRGQAQLGSQHGSNP